MWFRNLQIYRLPANWGLTAEALNEKLSVRHFIPCGSQDKSSRGWSSPTGDDRFVLTVQGHLTGWLAANEATGNFTIDQDCELRAVTDEKAAVRYVRHAIDGKDVQEHLAAGKLPTRIALTFDDRVSFVLTESMAIKRVAFLDVVKEEAERQAEAAEMQMQADFALMSGELSRLIPALLDVLGGEVDGGL